METPNHDAMLAGLNDAAEALRSQMPGGLADQMGLHAVDCDPATRTGVFESAVPAPWMRNPMGWLHGGMIASFLDSSMGIHCAMYCGNVATPTINLQVSYLRPAPSDRPVRITTHVTKAGRSVIFTQGTLWDEDESNPCATATAVFHVPK